MKTEFPKYSKRGGVQKVKERMDSLSLNEMDKFLGYCSRSAGKITQQRIEIPIIQFYDITEKPLTTKPNQEDIANFLSLIKEKRDRNKIKVNVKRFLKWKWKDLDLLEVFEFKWNKKLQPKYSENDMLTAQDEEKLIRASPTLMWKCVTNLLSECGMRPSELVNLKWKDIKYKDDGTADINLFSKKTGESRIFPVVNSVIHLKRHYQEYPFPNPNKEDYIFPASYSREKASSTNRILRTLKRIAKKSGLSENKFSTYLYRHGKATELYGKLPEQVVEKLLGHRGMASVYTHLSNEKARKELLAMMKVEELTPEKKDELEKLKAEMEKMKEFMKLLAEKYHVPVNGKPEEIDIRLGDL